MSSSPNLLDKDDDDDDPSAEVEEGDDDDDDPSADVNEEDDDNEDPSAMVDVEDELSDEVNIEAVLEQKGQSRFQWSHTADCIVDNGNSKNKALICILLVKELWNAGHSQVMKAWQNLLVIVFEMVVDGDKIFQGVSEATLKKVSVIS